MSSIAPARRDRAAPLRTHRVGRDRDRATPSRDRVTAVITLASFVLLATCCWCGTRPARRSGARSPRRWRACVGALSLAFLAIRGRSRVARLALYALWLTVAFFGFGGYKSHRLPGPRTPSTHGRARRWRRSSSPAGHRRRGRPAHPARKED